MNTAIAPEREQLQSPATEQMFVVWIDTWAGLSSEPDWEIDNPQGRELETLSQALAHAAMVRAEGFPTAIVLAGHTPRSDGLMSNPLY